MVPIVKVIKRIIRIICGKKGIYGSIGEKNHFKEGVLIYENAKVGNYNYFAPYCLINNAQIGNYNSIGPGCMIGLGEHDLNAISTYPRMANGRGEMHTLHLEKPAIIENDVWIGANVSIKQGVHVETGAVVGANAVVTHDVPAYAVVVGNPAKILKYRFDREFIVKLLESKWYEKSFEEAKDVICEIYKNGKCQ